MEKKPRLRFDDGSFIVAEAIWILPQLMSAFMLILVASSGWRSHRDTSATPTRTERHQLVEIGMAVDDPLVIDSDAPCAHLHGLKTRGARILKSAVASARSVRIGIDAGAAPAVAISCSLPIRPSPVGCKGGACGRCASAGPWLLQQRSVRWGRALCH